jgi:hypothetical protein
MWYKAAVSIWPKACPAVTKSNTSKIGVTTLVFINLLLMTFSPFDMRRPSLFLFL